MLIGDVSIENKMHFQALLLIAHYFATRAACQQVQSLKYIAVKISVSLLRYTDIIPADRAYYEAGKCFSQLLICFHPCIWNHHIKLTFFCNLNCLSLRLWCRCRFEGQWKAFRSFCFPEPLLRHMWSNWRRRRTTGGPFRSNANRFSVQYSNTEWIIPQRRVEASWKHPWMGTHRQHGPKRRTGE